MNSNRVAPIAIAVCLAGITMLVTVYFWSGKRYGEVSEHGCAIATSLNSACRLKSTTRIERIAAEIEKSVADASLTEQEASWLREVVELAKAQRWQQSQTRINRLLGDQVVANNDLPDLN